MKPTAIFLSLALALTACGQSPEKPVVKAEPAVLEFLTGSELKDWKVIDEIQDHGAVSLKDGVLSLGAGKPMTCVAYTGKATLPVKDYEISFEARRVDGEDFFAALTFPVRDDKSHVTLVVGGWGGKCVGISCIQYMSADENDTTNWIEFETKKWYKFRVEVRENSLTGFVDDKKIFEADTEGKKLSLRFGDIEFCKPLGFASYLSDSEIKNLRIKKLPPAEGAPGAPAETK